MKSLFVLAFVAVAFQPILATKGIDAIQAISVNGFKCLQNEGYSFFIGRVFTSLGHVDLGGMRNIKNAHAAGMQQVDGYFFPCLKTTCGSASSQIEKAVNRMRTEGVQVGTLWLDVEIHAWPASHVNNRAFVKEMVAKAQDMGVTIGIYSSYVNWQAIVGSTWNEVSNLPLWWGDYNGHEDFTGFHSFGGWSKPQIHQYAGNIRTGCGINVDISWY